MVTKDLQTLNFKFEQVMFHSLVLTWEKILKSLFFVFTKKNSPQICLILDQFNLYVMLISGKEIGDN